MATKYKPRKYIWRYRNGKLVKFPRWILDWRNKLRAEGYKLSDQLLPKTPNRQGTTGKTKRPDKLWDMFKK